MHTTFIVVMKSMQPSPAAEFHIFHFQFTLSTHSLKIMKKKIEQHFSLHTVEPPISGHPQDKKKYLLKRGVRLWEVKNVVFVCS